MSNQAALRAILERQAREATPHELDEQIEFAKAEEDVRAYAVFMSEYDRRTHAETTTLAESSLPQLRT